MIPDDVALDLHDRLTRGQSLTEDERAALQRWYAAQDTAETALLGQSVGVETLHRLQEQVEGMLAKIADVSTHIGEIAAENDAIRRENTALRRRLAQRVPSEST